MDLETSPVTPAAAHARPTTTLVGGPTLRLTYAGLTFLTDPTFDEPGTYPSPGATLTKLRGPAVGAAELGPVDVVLLSHDEHADNLDASGRALLPAAGSVLTTPAAASRLTDVPAARGLEPWEDVTLAGPAGDVVVTAVPARHGPEGCEPLTGPVTGFVLRALGEPTVYVSGDNASVEIAAEIARRVPDVTLAVLFAGDAQTPGLPGEPLTLDAERALAVAGLWPDAVVVPVHTEDWAHFSQPLALLVETFAAAGEAHRLRVPRRGETASV
ncbi:MBL fold metallo-hydrolase [Cellulomonas sp. NS3]|uniref:MBL fold metallo-hydrolase n=1 Tax=Cellulomonas sp. NS3 TaxID=2973977 RepID=UPI0021620A5D|nr:MBL fold metallo-hydrolase [Cellulomonas sp. NS3]